VVTSWFNQGLWLWSWRRRRVWTMEAGEGRCVMFPVQFLMERRRWLLPACVHRRQFSRSFRVVRSSAAVSIARHQKT